MTKHNKEKRRERGREADSTTHRPRFVILKDSVTWEDQVAATSATNYQRHITVHGRLWVEKEVFAFCNVTFVLVSATMRYFTAQNMLGLLKRN